jgi:hypothetical protein
MTQARRESGRLAADGRYGLDKFTTFLAGGRTGLGMPPEYGAIAGATLRFLLPVDFLASEADGVASNPRGHSEVILGEIGAIPV